MNGLFVFLLLIALGLLVWGLVSPDSLSKQFSKRSKAKLTRRHFGLVFGAIAIVLFILVGVTAAKQPSNQTVKLTTDKSSAQSAPATTTKTVTKTKPISYTSTTVQDSSLDKGTSKVTTKGVNGVETLTYKDTYTNGKLTSHQLVSDVVTTKPVMQVTSIGTYVAPTTSSTPTSCTNGTYVNSEGNMVCRPETANSAPAGATAQCVDGTYSFSQSHSGTCSHHGGVAQWL